MTDSFPPDGRPSARRLGEVISPQSGNELVGPSFGPPTDDVVGRGPAQVDRTPDADTWAVLVWTPSDQNGQRVYFHARGLPSRDAARAEALNAARRKWGMLAPDPAGLLYFETTDGIVVVRDGRMLGPRLIHEVKIVRELS